MTPVTDRLTTSRKRVGFGGKEALAPARAVGHEFHLSPGNDQIQSDQIPLAKKDGRAGL
jgi:hypothetical protein